MARRTRIGTISAIDEDGITVVYSDGEVDVIEVEELALLDGWVGDVVEVTVIESSDDIPTVELN